MSNKLDITILRNAISINGHTFKSKQIFKISSNTKFTKASTGTKLLLRLSNILNFDNLLKYFFLSQGMI